MSALRIAGLNLRHGLLHAVRDISLDVASGEVVTLVGANGAGKTTLLRAIAGAHPLTSGTISLDGKDISTAPAHARVAMGIALVPEGRRLFTEMTVEENLELGRITGRGGPWTIDKVIETFPNLAARRKAKAGTLSGGEQQATAIGRALMSNPSVLLLDEVSLGLSPIAVERLYASLGDLMQSGTTIVLVEQDLSRAMRVASRVVCMLEGRIVLEGATSAVAREKVTEAYFGLHREPVTA
jgi:branched-chain amino acid transport system ATP-binding protein